MHVLIVILAVRVMAPAQFIAGVALAVFDRVDEVM